MQRRVSNTVVILLVQFNSGYFTHSHTRPVSPVLFPKMLSASLMLHQSADSSPDLTSCCKDKHETQSPQSGEGGKVNKDRKEKCRAARSSCPSRDSSL